MDDLYAPTITKITRAFCTNENLSTYVKGQDIWIRWNTECSEHLRNWLNHWRTKCNLPLCKDISVVRLCRHQGDNQDQAIPNTIFILNPFVLVVGPLSFLSQLWGAMMDRLFLSVTIVDSCYKSLSLSLSLTDTHRDRERERIEWCKVLKRLITKAFDRFVSSLENNLPVSHSNVSFVKLNQNKIFGTERPQR